MKKKYLLIIILVLLVEIVFTSLTHAWLHPGFAPGLIMCLVLWWQGYQYGDVILIAAVAGLLHDTLTANPAGTFSFGYLFSLVVVWVARQTATPGNSRTSFAGLLLLAQAALVLWQIFWPMAFISFSVDKHFILHGILDNIAPSVLNLLLAAVIMRGLRTLDYRYV